LLAERLRSRYRKAMIAKLYGRIDETGVDHLVIDVNGVGYLVQASARTLAALGKSDDFATVFTEMQVSENDMRLIGFATKEERDWFRLLTGVQGVGGKVGLAILSAIEPADLVLAIGGGDAAMVARANGVGPKLASRIVNELKDKVGALAGIGGGAKLMAGAGSAGHASDAMSALTGLGFKPGEAGSAVAQAVEELGADATLDALVRLALKRASR
jgi:holliday junction DNA helicase RuvA